MASHSRPLPSPIAAFATFLDLDQLLARVTTYAAESAGADSITILLHDREAQQFVVAAAFGPGVHATRGDRVPDAQGVAGAVLRSSEPRMIADQSSMVAPLCVDQRTIGVVEATGHDGRPFGTPDLERFTSCCSLIAVALESASLYRGLRLETENLQRYRDDRVHPFVAESPAMRLAIAQADRAAAGRSTVLLLGETGTGKEQIARRIHDASPRAKRPYVALNCGALPESLIESELFGHEKGAFTGADHRHIGRFELAEDGTIFLDEIGDLPATVQVKLLRVLQEHEITRVGGTQAIRVTARVIAATHRDLQAEVEAGRFREDLFFRIHVVPIQLPPLRDRPDDVQPLTTLFLDRFARELDRPARTVTAEAMTLLRSHKWPGNVRELENLCERLIVLGEGGPIDVNELSGLLPHRDPPRVDAAHVPAIGDLSLWEQEHLLLVQALEHAGHNQTHAARALKISREQLRLRMKRYGLLPKER